MNRTYLLTRPFLFLLSFSFMALASSPLLTAEVLYSNSRGFGSHHQAKVHVSSQEAYHGLVRIEDWWNPAHTFSGEVERLSLDPRPNGCFCESLEGGGGVRHMTVVFAQPGKVLRLVGGLGPLQALPVSGVLTFDLDSDRENGTTQLDVVYRVSGEVDGGLEGWAGTVDKVIGEQVERLQIYLENRTGLE